jgi:acetyl-CoA acyltransferase
MSEAYIVSAVRTPCGRGKKGSLRETRPEDLIKPVIQEHFKRVKNLSPEDVDDVILGCAMPEGPQGMNLARICALHSGLPARVPGVTVNRFCSSGVQTVAQAAANVIAGWNDVVIAGGVESMSLVPMIGFHFSAHNEIALEHPEIYVSMGTSAENVAKKYKVSREAQDAFAVESHRKAAQAWETGTFADEVVPLSYTLTDPATGQSTQGLLERDELIRPGTSMETLAKLRPVFNPRGSVTAGNASPLTDGAASVLVMSEAAVQRTGAVPLARLVAFQVEGVPPEIMGIGPIAAIPKVCKKAGISVDQVDLFEINEAFAAQAVPCVQELGLDPSKVNVNGGAIALGHPLGATGSKLTATLVHQMNRQGARYGIVSMCIGGGMGAAALFERV